jgi:hypothetical protein
LVFAIRAPIVMIRVGRAFFRMAHAEIVSLGMISIPMLERSSERFVCVAQKLGGTD